MTPPINIEEAVIDNGSASASAPFTPHFPAVVDSTMLSAYGSCPTKFFYEYVQCLSSMAISPDLHAGGAIARGLEVARKAFYLHGMDHSAAVLAGFKAYMSFWGEYEPPEVYDAKSGRYSNHPKDFVNTGDAFIDYFREYPMDSDPIQPYIMAGDIPAIEFTFAIPLPIPHPVTGDPIIYGGRLDMLGYYNNLVAVIDEKTSKSIQSNYSNLARMRGQFLGYVWAAREYGVPAQVVLVRLIAIQKTQTRHMEVITPIENHMIERWHKNMLQRVQAMADDYRAGEWELSFGDACASYGGCAMIDLCTSRDPELWFDSFQRRIWNPLWRNPTAEEENAR